MAIALDQGYVASAADVEEEETRTDLPFSFNGKASEYFGIWIVNIFLSIITLGIYSAWAKVRNKRYFYGSTFLDGNSFAYLASPIQILKGRIIMFVFFVAYAMVSSFYPTLVGIFILFIFLITPWVMIRALAFNARNSAYRNVRFDFTGRLWEAIKLYLLLPIATVLTLGGLIPYQAFRLNEFVANHSRYGRSDFSFKGSASEYYKMYGLAALIALPFLLFYGTFAVFGVYLTIKTYGLDPEAAGQEGTKLTTELMASYGGYFNWIPVDTLPFLALFSIALAVIAYTYLATRIQNYFFNNTKVDRHQLQLNLSFWRVLWIRVTNLIVIAITLGLMTPWARIRMARYQIGQMSLISHGDLDTAVGDEQRRVSALGDEFGEGMDLDLGLGV